MPRKISREKELRWREVLKRQADSGLSIRKFCEAEGIAEPSFYAWRKKLRERRGDGAAPTAPRSSRAIDESPKGSLFVPLKLLDAAPMLEIVHPLGYRVRVAGEVNPVVLRQVIQTLDEGGAR
jgi:hypothetical protein